MLGNNIYDHYWWFYMTWNWFWALIRQFFHLRPSKRPCIILSRMSQLSGKIYKIKMKNERKLHKIFPPWISVLCLLVVSSPLQSEDGLQRAEDGWQELACLTAAAGGHLSIICTLHKCRAHQLRHQCTLFLESGSMAANMAMSSI